MNQTIAALAQSAVDSGISPVIALKRLLGALEDHKG